MNYQTPPTDRPLRLAFLGCGGVTTKHSKTLKGWKNTELFYASRSEKKAAEFAKRYNGKGFFGSYEAAILSPEIDVVLIATPPDSHLGLALAAVRAGKHVIVEKPPFFKSSDFDLIDAERKKTGVQAMVAENYFYKPLRKKLAAILAAGLIGEVRFMYFNSTKKQTTGDWRDEAIAGGGALFEGGIHWINFINNIGLKIKKVTGFRPGQRNLQGFKNLGGLTPSGGLPPPLERSMQVVAEYEEGPVATLLYSWELGALLNGIRISRIYGTGGSITLESNGIFIFVRGKKWKFILPGFADIGGSKGMFRDFFRAIRSGEEPEFNFAMAKRDLELVEEAYGKM